jgi:hypothetical protein
MSPFLQLNSSTLGSKRQGDRLATAEVRMTKACNRRKSRHSSFTKTHHLVPQGTLSSKRKDTPPVCKSNPNLTRDRQLYLTHQAFYPSAVQNLLCLE